MPEKTGSQCISCSDRKVRERREAFATANQTSKNWRTVAPKLDTSGISAQQKLGYLRAARTDLSHFGGRDGIVSALKRSGIVWPLIPPGCPVLGGPLRPVSAQYKQRRCLRPATAPTYSPPGRRGDRMGPEVHCSVQAKEVDHAAGSLLYFPQSVGLGLGPQAGQPEECAEHKCQGHIEQGLPGLWNANNGPSISQWPIIISLYS